LILLC